jgi:hypothetical protein
MPQGRHKSRRWQLEQEVFNGATGVNCRVWTTGMMCTVRAVAGCVAAAVMVVPLSEISA